MPPHPLLLLLAEEVAPLLLLLPRPGRLPPLPVPAPLPRSPAETWQLVLLLLVLLLPPRAQVSAAPPLLLLQIVGTAA
jgi:hypothetical protein